MKYLLICIASTVAQFALGPATATGQGIRHDATIHLSRLYDSNGDVRYEVRTAGFGFPIGNATGPSGRVFGNGPPLENLTEAEMVSEIVGNWSVNAPPPGPPSSPQVHQFTIAPFLPNDIFIAQPAIVSPSAAATVPRDFSVHWDWPDGVSPPAGHAISARTGGNLTNVDFGVYNNDNSLPVSVQFVSGVTQTGMQIRAGSSEIIDQFVSPVTTTTPSPYWSLGVHLRHANLSPAVRVTILNVPEPSTAVLAAIALLACGSGRRSFTHR